MGGAPKTPTWAPIALDPQPTGCPEVAGHWLSRSSLFAAAGLVRGRGGRGGHGLDRAAGRVRLPKGRAL